LSISVAQR